jgi:hypothetical protein
MFRTAIAFSNQPQRFHNDGHLHSVSYKARQLFAEDDRFLTYRLEKAPRAIE